MIIYNTTIKVDWSIHEEWLHWIKEDEIPETLATQVFYQYQLARLLEIDETDGPTYILQFYAHTIWHYNQYIEQHSVLQAQKGFAKWGHRIVHFRTLMEVVN